MMKYRTGLKDRGCQRKYWKAMCTEKRAAERKEWNWKVEV